MSTPPTLHDWARAMNQCGRYMQQNPQRFPAPATATPPRVPDNVGQFRYIGNPQNLMPPALLLDGRLTPLERNAWQALHFLLVERHVSHPRYEDLQPYLSCVPCGHKASRETVARVLHTLRLTRWLSLVSHLRDERGQLRPPVYVLHDNSLTPAEALQLDETYGELIKRSLQHAAKGVRITANYVLKELRGDRTLPPGLLPQVLALVPAAPQQHALNLAPGSTRIESEQPTLAPVRAIAVVNVRSELPSDLACAAAVRIPNAPSTVQERIEHKRTEHTVQHEQHTPALAWPPSLAITANEQRTAWLAMAPLSDDARSAVLKEAVARCTSGAVRHPAAYLMGLIRKALKGEFRLWAGKDNAEQPRMASPTLDERVPLPRTASCPSAPLSASPVAQACLEQLRRQCRLSKSA